MSVEEKETLGEDLFVCLFFRNNRCGEINVHVSSQ